MAAGDERAKELVARLYDEFGFDALDLGGLDESWRADPGQKAFVTRQNLAELRAHVAGATFVPGTGVGYWSPARTEVMRCVLKPSQCIRPR